MLLSSMLKLRFVRAIPNVITYLSFVFPTNLIWFNLLHCNAMNFDSFSLDARHLFQNVVFFFFLYEVTHVIHCCFQNKNLYQNY
jgi:hypothetical protein